MADSEPVEVFFTPDFKAACKWGVIEHPDPQPDLGLIGHLMLITVEQAERLLEGPQRHHGGIAQARYDGDGKRIYVDLDYRGNQWVWLLHPAEFFDGEGPPIFLGAWPD